MPITPRLLPPDHPDRVLLAAEVHARPPEPLAAPSRATYVAVRIDADARAAERAHIHTLCQHYGLAIPDDSGTTTLTQWAATLGPLRFKWERHGEFSSYTFFAAGLSATPFAEPVAALLPTGWLAAVPGQTVFAAHAKLAGAALADNAPAPGSASTAAQNAAPTAAPTAASIAASTAAPTAAPAASPAASPAAAAQPVTPPAQAPAQALSEPFADRLAAHFNHNVVVGAAIGEGAGLAFTDFVIHGDGFARFVLIDREMTPRQAGRMLQRLFEIEAYRMMALLALPLARGLWPRLLQIERTLASLTERIASATPGQASGSGSGSSSGSDEALLHALMALAAEVESALAGSQARFGASRAYHALVVTRIAELREQRIKGLQTFDEFMTRRLSPAMATCATVSQRLHDLSERVAQASSLLSTRVDIARQQQNQALLAATARRAKLQLRLQQTVEGLSVAAIVYYLAGLVGYCAKAIKAAGVALSPDLVTGAAVPLLALGAWWVLRRVHRRIAQDDRSGSYG